MRRRTVRPTRRISALGVAATLVVAVTLSGSGASAQNVESLRARAERLANELDGLERRASELDEQYLQLTTELEELESKRGEQQRAVDEAAAAVDAARAEARGYVVEAYIGAGASEQITMTSGDVNTAVNHRTLLEIVRGDREGVADQLDVSREDHALRVAELERSERALEERRAEQERVVSELESAVGEHQSLLDDANAEVRAAVEAERRRREAEAEAAAARAAERAAARAASAERAQARTRSTAAATARSSSPAAERAASPVAPSAPSPQAPAAPAAPAVPVSAPNGRAAGAIAAARSMLGTPYRWAGSSPGGFDCSGLMLWSWAQVGVSLPRTSGSQYAGTQRISAAQLQPGDLVFFGSPIHHVGMYVGGGQMVHSPRTGDVVKISPIHRGFGSPSGYGRVR